MRSESRSSEATAETRPDDPAWLRALIARSPLLPDATVRAHWHRLTPWLPVQLRYELAGILLDIELACRG